MKKSIYNLLLLLISLVGLMSSCNKEELVFDHELPQFELRSDAILLEVIMPRGTSLDDQIYIAGAFNGGDEVALQDLKWQLEKAPNSDVKWGIYLYPEDFVSGKSLADGFHFISKKEGVERTLQNGDASHLLTVEVGSRTNVTVDRWNSYFVVPEEPVEITHDGYVVYVLDHSGWKSLYMYAWGSDLPELFGGWPGVQPTGTIEIDGQTYKYFDTGESNKGLTYNLIVNNNADTQIDGPAIVLNKDYYFEIVDGKWVAINQAPEIRHDGYTIFVEDQTGWDEVAMYAWGNDLPELFGGWPGKKPTGIVEINGVSYKYFDTGESNKGLAYNLILNNNGNGSQLKDFGVKLDRDYYFRATTDGLVEVDPQNPNADSE